MKKTYNALYRSCLSDSEKKEFKQLALKKGSVTEIHDSLLREFIKRERENASSDRRA